MVGLRILCRAVVGLAEVDGHRPPTFVIFSRCSSDPDFEFSEIVLNLSASHHLHLSTIIA
jgi:hypothetical protein